MPFPPGAKDDALLHQAAELLRERCRMADNRVIPDPISWLPRELRAGYARTQALIDELEAFGALSPIVQRTQAWSLGGSTPT